jgi:Mg-chelatase subunit ChlI
MGVNMWPVFPFTAIVGQEKMKRGLVLNAVSPQIGGVLIRGERGTAKSTAARALAALLPAIEVVEGCPFSCDPDDIRNLCTDCQDRLARGERLRSVLRRTPFIDLPVSATEDRVVGTLDMERALREGVRHFEPGVLAAANRGLLYVDEVNLLDDHVVDLLLDSAAMGVNVVEREGISFIHPARFILVGTMNPEEGELRPQLLDRFALCVEIRSLPEAEDRVQVLERRLAYEADPEGFSRAWAAAEEALSRQITNARERVPMVRHTERDLRTIAELTASLDVDGHRGDIVILKSAHASAALEGRDSISDTDIIQAAELALPHRLRRRPFQEGDVEPEQLEQRLEEVRARVQTASPSGGEPGVVKKKT